MDASLVIVDRQYPWATARVVSRHDSLQGLAGAYNKLVRSGENYARMIVDGKRVAELDILKALRAEALGGAR